MKKGPFENCNYCYIYSSTSTPASKGLYCIITVAESSTCIALICRYLESKSGIYCGPLKMLAVEIAQKSNDNGIPCDLVTGEERKLADPEGKALRTVYFQ